MNVSNEMNINKWRSCFEYLGLRNELKKKKKIFFLKKKRRKNKNQFNLLITSVRVLEIDKRKKI